MQSPLFLYDYNSTSPPSPPPLPPAASAFHHHRFPVHIFIPLLAAAGGVLFLTLVIIVCAVVVYRRKLSNKRTAPADLEKPPETHRFSYSLLKRATSSFAAVNRVGQGGFGSVYKGTLPSGEEIAVKVMDSSGSLQGDREFHNELTLSSRIDTLSCPQVVSFLGFSYDKRSRKKRVVLVFEYMPNGNLQDAMLDRKCPELMQWKKRFRIILDVAKGIEYLHNLCDPPIVHGDIKPSNILLDSRFDAKIADFGLAQALNKDDIWGAFVEDEGGKNGEDHGSIIEENESVLTAEEVVVNVYESPENSSSIQILDASPSEGLESKTNNTSERWFDRLSIDSKNRRGGIGQSRRDWWWKQDNVNGGLSESGRIKDYVMEWIGSEIRKERPKKDWIATNTSKSEGVNLKKKQKRKSFSWWGSLYTNEKITKKKSKKPREWWKEEFCEELAKKKKKKKKKNRGDEDDMWWQRDEDLVVPERKKRKKWGSSIGSFDGFSGFSGELFRRDSKDFASGEIPKSGGISSTPSMRGTVCYIAPEYGGGGQVSRKCDVYSFGVLVLVLVSGRRPLQITASPMSEFDRANLISWAKQLAMSGKLNELIDPSIQCLDRDQALRCITIALLCLQRSPSKRPKMEEIVGMLSGESEPPCLPFEFSPSPPPFKSSRKKPR